MSDPYTDEGAGAQHGARAAAPSTGPGPGEHPDDNLSYEQARQALGEVVQSLEAGGITLAESIALWERGERLANICQRLLDGAQERLDAAIERAQHTDGG